MFVHGLHRPTEPQTKENNRLHASISLRGIVCLAVGVRSSAEDDLSIGRLTFVFLRLGTGALGLNK
jgi:hypothetical protein